MVKMINELKKIREYFDIKETVKDIHGWLSSREIITLFEIAKHCKNGVIVEIGSWKGKSTICLSKGSKMGNKIPIYAIDPHTGSEEHQKKYGKVNTYDDFLENIKKANCDDLIIPIKKRSDDVIKDWNKKICFLFIDGAHDFNSVKMDFENFNKYLIKDGIVAFHDYTVWGGVTKYVDENLMKSKNFQHLETLGSVILFKKI